MPIDTAYFRNHPEEARNFLRGRDGVILSAVAVASACTNRRLIAGHFVFGGAELKRSGFLVHPDYQNILDADIETQLFASLAPFLAEYELLGQSNYEKHRAAIMEASRAFGTNYYIDSPSDLSQRIVEMIVNNGNEQRYDDFLELLNVNYDIINQKIGSVKYTMGDYKVMPSTILTTFCGTSLYERWKAMFKTCRQFEKSKALNRFLQEHQNMNVNYEA
jgi:hypothetical protein